MVAESKNTEKATAPWQQAWNAANAMSVSATRMAVGQMELAALTAQFMNQRLTAYASFDGRVEPLVRRLDKLTEQYADHYAAQVRSVYSWWPEVLREGGSSTDAAPLSPDGEAPRSAERAGTVKAKAHRTNGSKRAKQRRRATAH